MSGKQNPKSEAKAANEPPSSSAIPLAKDVVNRPKIRAVESAIVNIPLRKVQSEVPTTTQRHHPDDADDDVDDDSIDNIDVDPNAPTTSHFLHRSFSARPLPLRSTANTGVDGPETKLAQHLTGTLARIKRELSEVTKQPPPNIVGVTHSDDLHSWLATVSGPEGSVYEGGHFKLEIRFPPAYPFRPPRIRFLTRIYHCNVDSRGAICLDVLNERWSPVMTISKVLLSIWVLMGECNPDDPLVIGIADQYKCNRKEHDKMARYWTKRYAISKEKNVAPEKTEPTLTQSDPPNSPAESQESETTSAPVTPRPPPPPPPPAPTPPIPIPCSTPKI
ncbi:ubiquitin-conjugating enzyme E2 E3 [Scaptodrosophila lebanonensis]|uniref:E2 ubiquitin-conjugating enzyme n=1 Tax=Drosophila lebanonensis TaxID=7225 RepID=A0A6J2U3G9_DROLE|nr:ubiquitin-conjugating enzyme E2 E3 [Scaptodrosophila lebanonensis]